MRILPSTLTALFCVYLTLIKIDAEQDENFYGSFSNPNLNNEHYWSNSKNILEDLSKFDKLYVKFENCAWSSAKYNAGDFDDDDDGNNRKLEENQCGDGGGGEDYWWVGMSDCRQSNVAYSLYGTLIDEPRISFSFYDYMARRNTRSKCNKKTYINSFYTIDALHSFLKAASVNNEINTTGVVPYCSYYYDGEEQQNSHDRQLGGSQDNGDSLYYTTGCSASGNFTVATFNSATCNGNYYDETLHQLEELNDDMQNIECEQVYDSDGSLDYASTLLYYSEACSTSGTGKDFCPDPYGVLAYYEYNLAMSISNNSYVPPASSLQLDEEINPLWQLPFIEATMSCVFIVVGTLLVVKGIQQKSR